MTAAAAARRRLVGVHAEHPSYPWWVLSVTSLGMFLATVNSGTLLIALPDVEDPAGRRQPGELGEGHRQRSREAAHEPVIVIGIV